MKKFRLEEIMYDFDKAETQQGTYKESIDLKLSAIFKLLFNEAVDRDE